MDYVGLKVGLEAGGKSLVVQSVDGHFTDWAVVQYYNGTSRMVRLPESSTTQSYATRMTHEAITFPLWSAELSGR
jgi:hypothetical protein